MCSLSTPWFSIRNQEGEQWQNENCLLTVFISSKRSLWSLLMHTKADTHTHTFVHIIYIVHIHAFYQTQYASHTLDTRMHRDKDQSWRVSLFYTLANGTRSCNAVVWKDTQRALKPAIYHLMSLRGIHRQQHPSSAGLNSISSSHKLCSFPVEFEGEKKSKEKKAHQSESWEQRLPQRVCDVCIHLSDNNLPRSVFKCLLELLETVEAFLPGAILRNVIIFYQPADKRACPMH